MRQVVSETLLWFQLREELTHERDAVRQRRRCALDAYAIGSREADAAVLLHERDQLAGVERRRLHELQRRPVGTRVHLDDAERPRREPDLSQPLGVTTEINLHAPARLPQDYCSDVHERLVLYKRLASTESIEALDALREELVDRFGPTPEPAQALLACHRLRIMARPLGVVKADAGPDRTTLQFVKTPPFDAGKLIALVQKDGRIRFAGPDRVRIERAAPTLSDRVALVREFLAKLQPK